MKDISSTGSFIDFTLENFIYVDKTEYIPKLVKLKRVFISRPRRFGKSLTLDTIATLFETGVEPYFKGTWIYDKWTEPTYPVLRLNFLNFDKNSIEKFNNKLNSCLLYTSPSPRDRLIYLVCRLLLLPSLYMWLLD